MTQPTIETKLIEYDKTQDAYLHYDAFRWQAGSFLIAGVFIFWGLLLQQHTKASVAGIASLLIAALMSTWLLFAHHYRQIYLCKLERLWELEDELGMQQHVRFRARVYDARGPRGHTLDMVVYGVVIIGTPALGFARNGFSVWYLPALVIGALILSVVMRNERLGPIRPRGVTGLSSEKDSCTLGSTR